MSVLPSEEEALAIIQKYFVEDFVESLELKRFAPIRDVEIRDDDVFLLGCAKSGTTWLQELIWLIGNDLNYEGASVFIDERVPVVELSIYYQNYNSGNILECHYDSMNYIKKMKSPRFIKSHVIPENLPTQLLSGEKKAKIVYVSRNVKDVCLSFYHYTKNILKVHNCSLDVFCKVFMGYKCTYWKSVLHFWNLRNKENVLFVKYEEMKTNLPQVIQKVAKFLGKTVTEAQQEELAKWLDFDKMKSNNAVNHENIYNTKGFIRNGKIGGYKEEMSQEVISLFDTWIKDSTKHSDYVDMQK